MKTYSPVGHEVDRIIDRVREQYSAGALIEETGQLYMDFGALPPAGSTKQGNRAEAKH